VFITAVFKSPCKILFGIVMRLDKLVNTLLVLDFIGEGKDLYPFATGLKITLSSPWFKTNDALFTFSKQSLVGFAFLDSLISPSDPAKAFDVSKVAINNIFIIFIIIDSIYNLYVDKVKRDLVLKMSKIRL
jgi:hypothetical protein